MASGVRGRRSCWDAVSRSAANVRDGSRSKGIDPKTAQGRLGHSDIRLTLGVSAQHTTAADRAAADVLGEALYRPRDARGIRRYRVKRADASEAY